MKLTFFGAAKAVTGSCHCLDVNGKRILIDCGLQQGRDEYNENRLEFAPNEVDFLIATHAHIDHTGRIPLLVKDGFRGKIVTSRLTAQLMSIMLRDSAHIQESDAEWKNRKGQRAGKAEVEPLYTIQDAEDAMQLVESHEYGQKFTLCEGVEVSFTDAGHLLGSACIEMWLTEDGVTKKIVFSGDIGNVEQAVIRDPQPLYGADYVVMESTYGDRNHEPPESYTGELARVINDTFAMGGNVVIPCFAVGRTQELLYYIREIKEQGLVTSDPNFRVVVDSPLAGEATKIYSGNLDGYLDPEAWEKFSQGEKLFTFPNLDLVESSEESKALNMDTSSKVILSASGMCDAGRIRHHLKHNLWRPESTICFVGYQAEGSLGRKLLEGAPSVKLFGEEIAVRAKIVNFHGLSSHADRDHLIEWAKNFTEPQPQHFFIVHGDEEVTDIFANTLIELGLSAHAPLYREEYDLATCTKIADGIKIERSSKFVGAAKPSQAYTKLLDASRLLADVVSQSRGRSNKDLSNFADKLKALIEEWNA